ncbi:MAG: zinc ribbon domain-containing protein [Candidatus Gastranaerophilales bacterium]|nr:zinc ribbon domain-containing protein [Candidatus Gastranaerophilales bacterium]
MICPKCKAENDDGAIVCKNCNFKLKLKCPECGTYNTTGTKVCSNCSTKLLKTCPECKAVNFAQAKICRKCGIDFSAAVDAPIAHTEAEAPATAEPKPAGNIENVPVLAIELINFSVLKSKIKSPETAKKIIMKFYQIFVKEAQAFALKPKKISDNILTLEFRGYPSITAALDEALKFADNLREQIKEVNFTLETKLRTSYKSRIFIDITPLKASLQEILQYGVVNDVLVGEEAYNLLNNTYTFEKTDASLSFDLYKLQPDSETAVINKENIEAAPDVEVQRNNVFGELLQQLEKTDKGYVACLNAPDGMGKTNIFALFRNSLEDNKKQIWLMGQCSLACRHDIGAYFKDVLRNMFDLPALNIDVDNMKNRVYEAIAQKLGIADEDVMQDIFTFLFYDESYLAHNIFENKNRIYMAISKILMKLLFDNRVFLQIEDIEYIDELSLYILRRMFADGILNYDIKILISSNTQKSLNEIFAVEALTAENSAFYEFPPLTKDEIDNFINGLLQNKDILGDNLLNQLYANANGLPIYMEEFLYVLLQIGIIKFDREIPNKINIAPEAQQFTLPKNAEGIIKLRLNTVSQVNPNAFKALYYAAILGYKFVPPLLREILNVEEGEFNDIITYLAMNNFIYAFDSFNYAFKNKTIWTVVRNLELSPENKNFSLITATNIIAKATTGGFPLVVKNLEDAQTPPAGLLSFVESAAKEAYIAGDEVSYIYYKKKLLEIVEQSEYENKTEILLSIKEELARMTYLAHSEESVSYFKDLITHYEPVNTPKTIELLGFMSRAFENFGNYTVAIECVDKAIEKINIATNPVSYMTLCYSKLEHLLNSGTYEELINLATTAILPAVANIGKLSQQEETTLKPEEIAYIELDTKYLCGFALAMQGNIDCVAMLENVYASAVEYGYDDFSIKAQLAMATLRVLQGDIPEAQNILLTLQGLIPASPDSSYNTLQWYLLKNIAAILEGISTGVKDELNMLLNFAVNIRQFSYAAIIKALIGKLMISENPQDAKNYLYNIIIEATNQKLATAAFLGWHFHSEADILLQDYDNALHVAQNALEVAQNPKIRSLYFESLLSAKVAEIFYLKNDPEMAKIHLEMALKIAMQNENIYQQAIISLLYAQICLDEVKTNPSLIAANVQKAYKLLCAAQECLKNSQNKNLTIELQQKMNITTTIANDNQIKL